MGGRQLRPCKANRGQKFRFGIFFGNFKELGTIFGCFGIFLSLFPLGGIYKTLQVQNDKEMEPGATERIVTVSGQKSAVNLASQYVAEVIDEVLGRREQDLRRSETLHFFHSHFVSPFFLKYLQCMGFTAILCVDFSSLHIRFGSI